MLHNFFQQRRQEEQCLAYELFFRSADNRVPEMIAEQLLPLFQLNRCVLVLIRLIKRLDGVERLIVNFQS